MIESALDVSEMLGNNTDFPSNFPSDLLEEMQGYFQTYPKRLKPLLNELGSILTNAHEFYMYTDFNATDTIMNKTMDVDNDGRLIELAINYTISMNNRNDENVNLTQQCDIINAAQDVVEQFNVDVVKYQNELVEKLMGGEQSDDVHVKSLAEIKDQLNDFFSELRTWGHYTTKEETERRKTIIQGRIDVLDAFVARYDQRVDTDLQDFSDKIETAAQEVDKKLKDLCDKFEQLEPPALPEKVEIKRPTGSSNTTLGNVEA